MGRGKEINVMVGYSCETFTFQTVMRGKPKYNIKFDKYRKSWDAMKVERCGRRDVLYVHSSAGFSISFKDFWNITAFRIQVIF